MRHFISKTYFLAHDLISYVNENISRAHDISFIAHGFLKPIRFWLYISTTIKRIFYKISRAWNIKLTCLNVGNVSMITLPPFMSYVICKKWKVILSRIFLKISYQNDLKFLVIVNVLTYFRCDSSLETWSNLEFRLFKWVIVFTSKHKHINSFNYIDNESF